MNFTRKYPSRRSSSRISRSLILGSGSLIWLVLCILACGLPAQSQQPSAVPAAASDPSDPPGTGTSAAQQAPAQQSPGKIIGTIVDQSGTPVAGALVTIKPAEQSPLQQVLSGDTGQFSFDGISPGPFQLAITAQGFAAKTYSGNLHSGEVSILPQIILAIATVTTQVRAESQAELAEQQIKVQEKQRVFGLVPNFYVTYVGNAVPLTPRQKFELAWKSTIDPVTFVVTGAIAGIEQANDSFNGYGQGAAGYGKRYGASYADLMTGTYIGSAILPSLLKQDPRYFYRGTGTKRSRLLYALGNAFICKGDNGRWQPNYSTIFGNLAAGAISNAYYPANDRGAALTFERVGFGLGASAGVGVLQEFFLRKLSLSFHVRGAPKQ
ncbi:MAG: carboxypeptidase-like regulatory domain-containing protein [Candidatus Acidiferrales bacterium]